MKVSDLYIAQVKRKCGIELAENFNIPRSEGAKQPQCRRKKRGALRELKELKLKNQKKYMMYNPQLDTFICVVEAGSFSKAAEELYISAPAVIKQINSLENSLNLQLFERTHRGLIITEAGKSLYQDAKYLIQYSKESLIRAQEAMNHNEEIIRVGISPMTPPEVFVELWPKIQKIYPEMKFKLITFENTPENAREILANMGKNIDVIAGIFDETMLELRGCDGTEISKGTILCGGINSSQAGKKRKKLHLMIWLEKILCSCEEDGVIMAIC